MALHQGNGAARDETGCREAALPFWKYRMPPLPAGTAAYCWRCSVLLLLALHRSLFSRLPASLPKAAGESTGSTYAKCRIYSASTVHFRLLPADRCR